MRRRRRGQGFTVLELGVTLAIAGILAAMILPRLGSQGDAGGQIQAQISAAATAGQMVTAWRAAGGAQTAPVTLGDRDPAVAPGEPGGGSTDPLAAADLAGCDNPGSGAVNYQASEPASSTQTGNYPLTQATNCPAFANPYTLGKSLGGIAFTDAHTASGKPDAVSVAARRTVDGWQVAAAAQAGVGDTGTCMAVVHHFATPAATSGETETFYVTSGAEGPGSCDAATVLATYPAADQTGPTGLTCQPTTAGRSWSAPCLINMPAAQP